MAWSFALLRRPMVITLTCLAFGSCTSSQFEARAQNDKPKPTVNRPAEAPWGPKCNDTLLTKDFALSQATDFKITPAEKSRIDEVVNELKRGYGGTLVTAPPDAVLDSPAFLAHYLRAFSVPGDIQRYDYVFERILARLSGAEKVLDDRRLDWDIWRAFLLFENFVAGGNDADSYVTNPGGPAYRNNLNSAKDLLWWYLAHNSTQIRKDKQRQEWWVNRLTTGMRAPGGRPMRRWFLLQLVAGTDTKTAALQPVGKGKGGSDRFPVQVPTPFDPFLMTDEVPFLENNRPQPPFLEAIKKIADSQKLSYTLWNIDPGTMPATKAVEVDLAPRLSQVAPASILSQESWSKKPQPYGAEFSHPVGRRSAHYNVNFPVADNADGVYFFTWNARLYIWPKARMDDAAIELLQMSGLIDEKRREQFIAEGFTRMKVTGTSDK